MLQLSNSSPAPDGPGIEPRWTRSNKHGVGTAFSKDSKIWYTVSKGIVDEVYFPTIDTPQIRDLQFLITDGKTFVRGERQLENRHERLNAHTLGYRITNVDHEHHYQIEKKVIASPSNSCLLIQAKLEGKIQNLHLYALIAPHLEVGGHNNDAHIVGEHERRILVAHKGNTWLALRASIPFIETSCGYVGTNDGWTDLTQNFQLTKNFDCALNGNVALIGELDTANSQHFTLALGFGGNLADALNTLNQALSIPFEHQEDEFNKQWYQVNQWFDLPKKHSTADEGGLHLFSKNLIRAHEDKTFNGAIIASLSIPWGECRGDKDLGGYHLVWTRDMCHSATGLLAAGITDVPLKALIYLESTQNPDGGFYQNFWVNGRPNWRGVQLDETACPIILAWSLYQAKALQDFDPYPMVLKAAAFLIENGPVTPQERWEENSGYSPSTLAAHISALICASKFASLNGHENTAKYLIEYADFLESHLEQWTVTNQGSLVSGIPRHFIRLLPADAENSIPYGHIDEAKIELKNIEPGLQNTFAAKDIVDAGFLALVRYGIRNANDRLIEDSLAVVDAILKVDTVNGAAWRRYNHDGYGQRANGDPFHKWGFGHAWPVLTGERGHYELAAGRDPRAQIMAMERFASKTKLIPEQVWSLEDISNKHMFNGCPTGGAMPLVWAHAEYLQLVRSLSDQRVFTLIDEVSNRYPRPAGSESFEIWKFNRQVKTIPFSSTLRIQAKTPFCLHWSDNHWSDKNEEDSLPVGTGHEYVDLKNTRPEANSLKFTFFWKNSNNWEGRDFEVAINYK